MRALCGAIIAAGAMIGLGLTALGFGIRFQGFRETTDHGYMRYTTALEASLVILVLATLIGLAIAFVGLMFHHERRHRELSRDLGATTNTRSPV